MKTKVTALLFIALHAHIAPATSAQDRPSEKPKSEGAATTSDVEAKAAGVLTTNHGLPISDNQNQLKAGVRGPVLLEDFIFREKIQHFDHERIPERIVHARGSGAHGYFQCYESLSEITKAAFLPAPE